MSTAPEPAGTPGALRRLIDDAAIFPPGDAPLPEAAAAHLRHRSSPYAGLVGAFVVSDTRLPELADLVSTGSSTREALPVSIVVSGGAGALEPAVRWVRGAQRLELRAVEIAVRESDAGELSHNARRIVTVVDRLVAEGLLDEQTPVYVEPPRLLADTPSHSWSSVLDEVAAMDLRLKFRTGGLDAGDFPSAAELATSISSALDRELAFKCTAGLHHAVRMRDHDAFERPVDRHGFLNVLLATRASLDGATSAELVDLLDEQAPDAVAQLVTEAGDVALTSARAWFASVGSCGVLEPVADLVALGLLPEAVLSAA